jgi:hypothetical protein
MSRRLLVVGGFSGLGVQGAALFFEDAAANLEIIAKAVSYEIRGISMACLE